MLKVILICLFIFFLTLPLFGQQVDTAWVRRYNGPSNGADEARAIAVDDYGNVYVTGCSYSSVTDSDYVTIKYYPNGDTAWVRRYDGIGSSIDVAMDIAVDGAGNVYVTGYSWGGGTSYDYITIKYYPNGDIGWLRRFDSSVHGDWAYAIAVDGSGNVYVTGLSTAGAYFYSTVKYDSVGNELWVRGSGEVYWYPPAIKADNSGNVYVTGSDGSDYITIKYYPNGDTAWVRRYNGPGNGKDAAEAIAVDGSDNVYVTGRSFGSGTEEDYATIKYYPNGDTVWVRRYNGLAAGNDEPRAIVVDGSGNVYVTGYCWNVGTFTDFATIKYYPNGDTAWARRYNGPSNSYDEAYAMAVDGSGNVYVTGRSYGGGTSYDYATVKYDLNGNQFWVKKYNGPADSTDVGFRIAVDTSGNVYVTGMSQGNGTDFDYATIKYVQLRYLCGDVDSDGKVAVGDVVYLINYLFKSGAPPRCPEPFTSCADANGDGRITVSDVIYLINYLFKGGPPPVC